MESQKTVQGINVKARTSPDGKQGRRGFRRFGVTWPAAGQSVRLSDVDEKILLQLRADPHLVVTDVELPADFKGPVIRIPPDAPGEAPRAMGDVEILRIVKDLHERVEQLEDKVVNLEARLAAKEAKSK